MIAALLLAASVNPCSAAQTQMALDECWGRQAATASTRLRATYAAAAAAARPAGLAPALESAETAWLAARDKTCDLETSLYEGGSIEPMMASECVADQTQERTADLAALTRRIRAHARWGTLAPASRSIDAELNRVYGLYLRQVATLPAARRALIASEQTWLVYRDRECALERGDCLTRLEHERTNDLEDTWLGEVFW